MSSLSHAAQAPWQPFAAYGYTGRFATFNFDTILFTWISLACILAACIAIRLMLRYQPNGLVAYAARKGAELFTELIHDATGAYNRVHTGFVLVLFALITTFNIIILLPWCEEPTKDVNTTLALAFVAFCYVQYAAITSHGFAGYLMHYVKQPLAWVPSHTLYILYLLEVPARWLLNIVVTLVTLPLELLSKLSTILSLSFRLFGNIFGGSMITSMAQAFFAYHPLTQVLGILGGNLLIVLFFGVFEGLVQAFVFTMLTANYIGMNSAKDHA